MFSSPYFLNMKDFYKEINTLKLEIIEEIQKLVNSKLLDFESQRSKYGDIEILLPNSTYFINLIYVDNTQVTMRDPTCGEILTNDLNDFDIISLNNILDYILTYKEDNN